MLKKFNEYITESIIPSTILNNRGSSEISPSKFEQLLNLKCKSYINNSDNTKIYRGQRDMGDFVYFDPMKGEKRRSIESENIHINLIDNLPSWQKYPNYSRSVIGMAGKEVSVSGYGEVVYEVIPFDNSDVAICPRDNIWSSFGSDTWGSDIYLMDKLFKNLFDLEDDTEITERNLQQLKNIPTTIDSIITDDFLKSGIKEFIERDSSSLHGDAIESFYKPCKNNGNWKDKKFEELKGIDIYNYLNDCLFNPEVRGFSLVNYDNNFKVDIEKQIWTNGPVVMRKV